MATDVIKLNKYITKSGRVQIEKINKAVIKHISEEYERIFHIKKKNIKKVINEMKGEEWKEFSKKVKYTKIIVSNIPRWNKSYISRNPNSEQLWIPFSDFTVNSPKNKSAFSKKRSLIDINLSESCLIGSKFDGVDMFQACLEGAQLTNASFKSTNLDKANLNKSSMNEAILSKASLISATLAEAKLMEVNLNKANLNGADLTYAQLSGADIRGADFLNANLKGTEFVFAQIDGKTRFQKWKDAATISGKMGVDECTDFTGVNLESIALTPEDRSNLEKNIRKLRWNKWYKEKSKWISPSIINETKAKKTPRCYSKQKQNIKLCLNYILTFLIFICRLIMTFATHLFWVLSDYGTSTKRVLGFFVSWNILFATIYSICMAHFPNVFADANSVFSHTFQMDWISLIQTLIQSNFVAFNPGLLGIGTTIWWTILSFLHVIGCYFILAALLTRVAIMFQKQSP